MTAQPYGLAQASTWYLEETVATASPARLLCLLYDRLARDLGQGRTAMLAGRRDEADAKLEHAREILTELLTTLDGTAWDGAADLARIYAWMTSTVISGAVRGDAAAIASVHQLVVQLAEGWHGAAESLDGRAVVGA